MNNTQKDIKEKDKMYQIEKKRLKIITYHKNVYLKFTYTLNSLK